jgi:hypothetical protein
MIIVSQINKKIIGLRYFFKYIFVFLLSLLVFSCTKEEDNNTVNTIDITGEWNCHDNESANGIYAERNYIIDISKTDSNYVISNYASLGIDVTAYFNKSSNSFTVELQDVDGFQTHGTGVFSNDNKTATFTYYLDDEQISSDWTNN